MAPPADSACIHCSSAVAEAILIEGDEAPEIPASPRVTHVTNRPIDNWVMEQVGLGLWRRSSWTDHPKALGWTTCSQRGELGHRVAARDERVSRVRAGLGVTPTADAHRNGQGRAGRNMCPAHRSAFPQLQPMSSPSRIDRRRPEAAGRPMAPRTLRLSSRESECFRTGFHCL
jgi:hypothetical protein